MEIILASASPRRRELIKLISTNVKCVSADIDETLPSAISAEEAPEFLACQKALHVAKDYKDRLVIGCDTVVIINDVILGKPKDDKEAYFMLNLLSGRTHKVTTGCCLTKNGKSMSFSVTSEVTFYDLSDSEIKQYVESGECSDKAGAYGIQGKGSLLVEKIYGDYFNIVGLPVAELNRKIKVFLNENNC